VPGPGYLGVFDRSHYEDVLVARVDELVGPDEIERRYDAINAFERELVDDGTVVVKCLLHISKQTQRERLLRRLERADKHWKYDPGDLDVRARWDDYQAAYATALERTNTEQAPWHVVPSDRKWYRNLAVGQLLLEALRGLDLRWPPADFDVDAERERLLREDDAS
jgi:polyphosphate kinase 2 (PPK2 family)